ncbi:MAG: helix-turn-helix domain-containing protein [Peptostreptococcus sp.]|uniref:winged helix-turn-helix transcriptional regulator n=1 Tax=Peptostreptococcus sp. TaxID=1262 RepID=UPI002FC819B2
MKKKCPIEYTLSIISGKWKILILKELSSGPLRYGELIKSLTAISSKVLVDQLRELEKDGIINREIFPEVPPRVEYSLTERGSSIFIIFVEMRKWGLDNSSSDEVECNFCKKCIPYINTLK